MLPLPFVDYIESIFVPLSDIIGLYASQPSWYVVFIDYALIFVCDVENMCVCEFEMMLVLLLMW